MAKSYSIAGIRSGSVDTVTFSPWHGETVVRRRVVHVNDAKTKAQVKQRAYMMATQKGMKNITVDFLQKCFEKKHRYLSYANVFTRKNVGEAEIINKNYAKDQDIIGIGTWTLAEGSLVTGFHLINEALDNTTKYIGLKIADATGLAGDGNETVGAVSEELLNAYPFLKEGMMINMIGIINVDVKFQNNVESPLSFSSSNYYVKTIKQNFIIKKSDTAKMTAKGFTVKKGNDNAGYLLLLEEDLKTVCEDLKYGAGTNIGYAGLVVSQQNGNKTLVQSDICMPNKPMEDLMDLLENDVEKDCVNLKTYGYKEEAEIVNDEAI